MLTITDLLSITEIPKIHEVSLQTILEFYEQHVCGYRFIYEVDHNDHNVSQISIRFEPHHLWHLLGLHYIVRHKAREGYNLIKEGTITFDSLKSANKKQFKSKRDRMLCFPYVHQLLRNPSIIDFDQIQANTTMDAEIVFYDKLNDTRVHLGVTKDPDSNYFYPKSFYERNNDDHIDGQTAIILLDSSITNLI